MKRNTQNLGREDAYWNQLTPEQQATLRHDLLESNTSFAELAARAPAWATGPHQGKAPWPATLRRTFQRLRASQSVQQIQDRLGATPSIMGRLDDELIHGNAQAILDTLQPIIGQEILIRTLNNLDPAARTAAVRLLLKREDQHIQWAKHSLERQRLELTKQDRQDKLHPPNHAEGCITKEQWEQLERELNLM